MEPKIAAVMTCNDCGKESPFDFTDRSADPKCGVCGAFQMKVGQVVNFGGAIANYVTNAHLLGPEHFAKIKELATRFFFLAERRGVRYSPAELAVIAALQTDRGNESLLHVVPLIAATADALGISSATT